MSQTCSPSTQRRYGLARVCRVWELARSTVYLDHARRTTPAAGPRKRGPTPEWSDAELLERIQTVLTAADPAGAAAPAGDFRSRFPLLMATSLREHYAPQ